MIVHLNSGSESAQQLQQTPMVSAGHNGESMQDPSRDIAGEDRIAPMSSRSSSTLPPVEPQTETKLLAVFEEPQKHHQSGEQLDETAKNESEPLRQPHLGLLLKVSPEENTEFKQFADDEDDNDDNNADDSRDEQVSTQTVSPRIRLMESFERQNSPFHDSTLGASNCDVQMSSKPDRTEIQGCKLVAAEVAPSNIEEHSRDTNEPQNDEPIIELRFLVRRREAGALIGKRGSNIKRLREAFRSSMFSIPDTGNGPERVVCIATNDKSLDAILVDLTQLLMEKSPENDEQIELKLLIHSSHAGSIIGIGGQSIKKLRNESKAAIKIYEMCCPLSNERVCAIKAKPHVAVNTIKLIQAILTENPIKGTIKPYDALHFDIGLVDKYGGYLPDEPIDMMSNHYLYEPLATAYNRPFHEPRSDNYLPKGHYSIWRSPDYRESSCELHDVLIEPQKADVPVGCQHRATIGNQSSSASNQARLSPGKIASPNYGKMPVDTTTSVEGHATLAKRSESSGDHCDGQQQTSVKSIPHSPVYTQPASATRFHPYAPSLSNQSNFMTCNRLQVQRHQSPIMDGPAVCNGFPRFVYPYGTSQMQLQRVARCTRAPGMTNAPGAELTNVPDRCRHGARACPCMFMPMTIPDFISAGQFAQMSPFNFGARGGIGGAGAGPKSFHYYPRNPSQGMNKKR